GAVSCGLRLARHHDEVSMPVKHLPLESAARLGDVDRPRHLNGPLSNRGSRDVRAESGCDIPWFALPLTVPCIGGSNHAGRMVVRPESDYEISCSAAHDLAYCKGFRETIALSQDVQTGYAGP